MTTAQIRYAARFMAAMERCKKVGMSREQAVKLAQQVAKKEGDILCICCCDCGATLRGGAE